MRCPVCRAENGEEKTCRRCKADLSLLIELEASRRAALAKAGRAVAEGDGEQALYHAETAHRLRADRDSWRLLAMAHLINREYASAQAARERCS